MSESQLDANWKLESYFSNIYVINLARAPERLAKITQSLKEIGTTNFEVWRATDGKTEIEESIWRKLFMNWSKIDTSSPEGMELLESQFKGEAGIYLSYFRLISHVRENYQRAQQQLQIAQKANGQTQIDQAAQQVKKFSRFLALEDDNGFGFVNADLRSATRARAGSLFRKAMLELPDDWHMLYLHAAPREAPEVKSEHLAKMKRGLLLNAVAISHRAYDPLYDLLKKIFDPSTTQVRPVDGEISYYHLKAPCFAVVPSLAYQEAFTSSITSKPTQLLRQLQCYKDEQEEQFKNRYTNRFNSACKEP
jgi:GR25 family glycosyltransferase involved in LPS biosynthesis